MSRAWFIGLSLWAASAASAQPPGRGPVGHCPCVVQRQVASRLGAVATGQPRVRRQDGWLVISHDDLGSGIDAESSTVSLLVHEDSCFSVVITVSWELSSPSILHVDLGVDSVPAPLDLASLAVGHTLHAYDPAQHPLAEIWFSSHGRRHAGPPPRAHGAGPVWVSDLPGPAGAWRAPSAVEDAWLYDVGTGAVFVLPSQQREVAVAGVTILEATVSSRFQQTGIGVLDPDRGRRWITATLGPAVGRPHWIGGHRVWLFATVAAENTEYGATLIALHPERGIGRVLHLDVAEDDDGLPRAETVCGTGTESRCLRAQLRPLGLDVAVCAGRRDCQSQSYPLRVIEQVLEASAHDADPLPGQQSTEIP